ncbi:MAG: dihydroorotate dehydrogenase electron transfer subunit [Gammaproteobacteria bacterium]
MSNTHRNTIFVDEGQVLAQFAWPGEQFVTRLRAPKTAANALPGSFAHITCDPELPMRRPLSIMRVDATEGWIDVLYKIVGQGLLQLSRRRVGDPVSVLGPIGKPFALDPKRPKALLIGGGVGIPPMVFLAEAHRHESKAVWDPLVLMGSEIPFPFETSASNIKVAGIDPAASHTIDELEAQGIATRLASASGIEGCFDGYVTDLAAQWLASLSTSERAAVCIYACGPTPMLEAAARVAQRFDVPAQVSLEEYMACAVGGCAGCTVPVYDGDTVAMKRVCVDGPVFDASAVFPPAQSA